MATRNRGRPKKEVTADVLDFYRSLNFTWTDIAHTLGISRGVLLQRRIELHYQEYQPDDEELTNHIQQILNLTPEVGETYVIGALRAQNIRVPRERVREICRVIDAEGRERRRRTAIQRREYYVPGPNHLW